MELQKSLGKTILFITHDFDEALKIGDRIAVLKDGAVQQEGRPRTSCSSRPTSMSRTSCAR